MLTATVVAGAAGFLGLPPHGDVGLTCRARVVAAAKYWQQPGTDLAPDTADSGELGAEPGSLTQDGAMASSTQRRTPDDEQAPESVLAGHTGFVSGSRPGVV
jgi:hypothetical protein